MLPAVYHLDCVTFGNFSIFTNTDSYVIVTEMSFSYFNGGEENIE